MPREITVSSEILQGYRLDLICKTYFGYINEDIINKIIELNPQKNFFIDKIIIGDVLIIPKLSEII